MLWWIRQILPWNNWSESKVVFELTLMDIQNINMYIYIYICYIYYIYMCVCVLKSKWNWKRLWSTHPIIDKNLSSSKMHFDPNLEILSWIGSELSRGQAKHGVNSDFKAKFHFGGQGQSTLTMTGITANVFCIFCPNLMVLAWMGGDRTDRFQVNTHGHTHTYTGTSSQDNDTTRR